ncbi:MAG TPA: hypothetical protein VFA11_01500 [Acidimicrobiales bacterium]|nr:hypothetical protein [Acidimicrobiales bacterium]
MHKWVPGLAGTGAALAVLGLWGRIEDVAGFLLPTAVRESGTALVTCAPLLAPFDWTTLTRQDAFDAGARLAQALSRLHRGGIAHGALHSCNVLDAGDGSPLLADTGIGWLSGGGSPDDGVDRRAVARDVRALAGLALRSLNTSGPGHAHLADVTRMSDGRAASFGAEGVARLLRGAGRWRRGRRKTPALVAGAGCAALAAAVTHPWLRNAAGSPTQACGSVSLRQPIPPGATVVEGPVAGDGCAAVVTTGRYGEVISASGRITHFALGSAADVLLVGDWFCRGELLPAAYRPGQGELLEFRAWPRPGQPAISARSVATGVTGGRPVVVRWRGCDRVTMRGGRSTQDSEAGSRAASTASSGT